MTRPFTYVARSLISIFISILVLRCAPLADVQESDSEKSQWVKLGPGGGGSTFLPLFSASNPDNFLVRCDMTGTYHTRNGGQSYEQYNFPNGTSSYAFDPSNENNLYIGSSVLHQSTDGGKSWAQIFPDTSDIVDAIYTGDHATFKITTREGSLYPSDAGRISNIRVDPGNPDVLFFTMGRYFFHSSDRGKTWTRKETTSPVIALYAGNDATKDEVFLFAPDAMYVFDRKTGIMRTTALPPEMSPAFSFSAGVVKGDNRTIFFALHNVADADPDDEFGLTQLWTSEDRGQTWTAVENATITNAKTGLRPSYSMIACAEEDALHAYIVCNRYEEKKDNGERVYWYGALKTSDGGKSWAWVWKGGGGSGRYGIKDGQGVANLKDAWAEEAFGGEYIRLLDAGVFPKDGNVAVVTDWYRTMRTVDGGTSWDEVYSMKQDDGSYISRGMDVTTNYGVHFDPFDSSHIAVSYTDIGYHHSFNGGKSWFRSVAGVPSEWVNTCYWMVFDPDVKNKVWSVWSSLHDFPRGKMTRNPRWKQYGRGGVCVSTDGGKNWTPSNEGMGFDSPTTSIVLDPKSPPGQRTLYASVFSKGVFKSTDDGKTWALKNKGIDENTAAFELTISGNGDLFLTVSPTPVHKGGKAGLDFYSGAVYKSTDGAGSWTKLNIHDGLLFPNGIAIDPANPERIYLGCWSDITLSDLVGGGVVREAGGANRTLEMPGGIFLSEDGGVTWRSIFDDNQYVYDVTVDPYHPGRIYCNTFNQAAWRSDDSGKTWKKLDGYNFHWGHRVIIDENDPENIYLTTYGSSVLKSKF